MNFLKKMVLLLALLSLYIIYCIYGWLEQYI